MAAKEVLLQRSAALNANQEATDRVGLQRNLEPHSQSAGY
eukprot:CAMPEP_0172939074 /NCGR_PEP_ID=MMETSP1075-20121228/223346_1 /TAXON_ID=2916 /ORGANISM="Ceratium fusus, Strain PA161109" /LENGTH=39 /DNA_ID= /DNA_START= /DNA_END= /DNA_ORIENTATION=